MQEEIGEGIVEREAQSEKSVCKRVKNYFTYHIGL